MLEKLRTLTQTIETKEDLWHYLNIAMEVELSTIPPYLCALYSIEPGSNQDSYNIIKSVVIEEMLHLTLAANVLNATGGSSKLNEPEFIPSYPTQLPDSDIKDGNGHFVVPLQPFSRAAIKAFMKIEHPGRPTDPPEAAGWHTIGQFYDGLMTGLVQLCERQSAAAVFDGDPALQIRPEQYYGAEGTIIVVTDGDPDQRLENAMNAMREIVHQGEGLDDSVFDGDRLPAKGTDADPVPAHFYRFEQILRGQYYAAGDVRERPTGAHFDVDWNAAYPMGDSPKAGDYPVGSEISNYLQSFNRAYVNMLDELQLAFTGHPERLREGIGRMYKLKYEMSSLMKIPSGDGKTTVGPSFQFVGN